MNDSLLSQVRQFQERLTPEAFGKLVDARIGRLFASSLDLIGAHEGSVWLKRPDAESLVVVYNVGDRPAAVVGKVEQPLASGLVSKAYRDGQTVFHRGVFEHAEKSDQVDRQLGQLTAYQIAVPLRLFDLPCGVVTAIQTYHAGVTHKTKWGFEEADAARFETWVDALRGLLEYQCLRQVVDV